MNIKKFVIIYLGGIIIAIFIINPILKIELSYAVLIGNSIGAGLVAFIVS